MSKSILITGASSGIGRAAVERFHHLGYKVTATVRKTIDEENLKHDFKNVDVLNVDLDDSTQIDKVVGGYLENKGGIDILVNNAGYAAFGSVEETSLVDWRKQMETNFFAVIRLCQLAMPYMRARHYGRIVQISSGFGRVAIPLAGPYCASKYALEAMSESLRYEAAAHDVYVSLIEPGPVSTKFSANRKSAEASEHVDSPYRKFYAKVAELQDNALEMASPPEDIVEKIEEAVTSKHPALRYEVGLATSGALFAKKFIPQGILDWGIKTLVG